MGDSSTESLLKFLGDLVEDVIDGKVQVRLSNKELVGSARTFAKHRNISGDPRIMVEDWTRILNHPLFFKNYLIKYIPALDSVSFQWVPPWESISWAMEIRKENIKKELSESISNISFEGFEYLMRQVFMRIDWARDISVTKASHDYGVDFEGKFVEKSSGLLLPLVGQAKHWKAKIGSEEIRTFLGSIAVRNDHRNTVGVYVSTHGFTEEGLRVIRKSPNHIICYDLDRLADLMITNKIGVSAISIKGLGLDSGFWNDLDV